MVKVIELVDSREGTIATTAGSSWDRHYLILDTIDEIFAQAALEEELGFELGQVPPPFNNLPFQNYRISHKGGGVWDAMVKYGSKKQFEYSYDFTGGTFKRTQSLGSRYYPAVGRTAIDLKGAINVNFDKAIKTADGVEIACPKSAFVIKRWFEGELPQEFADALEKFVGKLNSEPILLFLNGVEYAWQGGELLYMGATGTNTDLADPEVTMRFAVSRHEPDIIINDADGNPVIIGIQKDGWENLSYIYESQIVETGGGKIQLPVPIQANVDRVFYDVEMGILFE